jgi:hypothetical protein
MDQLLDLYYLAFPTDRPTIRSLVAFVYFIEALQVGMLTYDAFTVYGLNFGNPNALAKLPMSWFSIPILTSLGAFIYF